MSKRKNIIRVGDIVKVINPEFFIRCGYNLCLKDETERIEKEYGEKINEFIDNFLNVPYLEEEQFNKYGFVLKTTPELCKSGKEIAKALAYAYIKRNNFGGRERKLFTERKEELINTEFRVYGIKYRKTGIYYPAGGGYDSYSGEYDYEPGGLDKEKTHKILEIFPTYNNINFINKLSEEFYIEAIHVEKISTKEEEY